MRDADMLLEQIEQARKDAEELSIQSQEQSGDAVDKRASRASRELGPGLARVADPLKRVLYYSRPWPPSP